MESIPILRRLNEVSSFDTALNPTAKGILILADGTLKIQNSAGQIVNYPAGTFLVKEIYPLEIIKVFNTGTSLTDQQILLAFDRAQS